MKELNERLGARDDVGLADRRAALRHADDRRQPGERDSGERTLRGLRVVKLEHRRARGDRAQHRHEAECRVELGEQRRRVAAHGVRKHEHAPAFGDGGADLLRQLNAEVRTLALTLEQERRRDEPLAAHHEHGDRRLFLDLAAVGQDAASATAKDCPRAGHAADGVQELVGARVGVAGDEDEGEVGAIRPAPPESIERCLERSAVGRPSNGKTRSGGDHDWTLTPLLLHFRPVGLRITQVDAFTDTPFAGNPAAVCLLPAPRDEGWMQSVAREMNLSETAFLVRQADGFALRWFTPAVEVALCGHATLASAHVLWEDGHLPSEQQARFHTKSGLLTGDRAGLAALPVRGVIVRSRADSAGYDFVSRFFAPGAGVPEDPVTGSAHCALGPFWQARLGKGELTAYQASPRGGIVRVRVAGDRVKLGGKAVTVLRGELL